MSPDGHWCPQNRGAMVWDREPCSFQFALSVSQTDVRPAADAANSQAASAQLNTIRMARARRSIPISTRLRKS